MEERILNEWTDLDIEYLKNNFCNHTKKELATALGRTENAIQLKANRIGLKREDKYFYRKDYFNEITTADQAYWLGFLYADGCVSKEKGKSSTYTVAIQLSIRDIDHLRNFNRDIYGNVGITTKHVDTMYNGKRVHGDTCLIRLYCSKMALDLISHGCCVNKSLIKDKPVGVPDKYMWDFIRGYFDGNGSFSHSYNKKNDKTYRRISIETGSKLFSEWLSKYLNDNDIKNNCYPDGKNAFKIQVSASKSVSKFLECIYNDAHRYLVRKYHDYLDAVCEDGTILTNYHGAKSVKA